MCTLPLDIADEEKIVRAIISPFHFDKGKNRLKPAAFRSKAGTDEVSVIRQTYMGSNFCKSKAISITAGSAQSEYVGLAVLTAGQVVSAGSTIHDSRDEYCGHAHISHGIISQPNEPQESAVSMDITERCRALVNAVTYHPDPNPSAPDWNGPIL